jgi:hypothetical protein
MNDIRSSGPGGPEDSMLEQRVAALETRVGRIDAALLRLEPAIRNIAGRLSDLKAKVADLDGRMAGIEGRLSQIPNVRQTMAISATLLIGMSGVFFAASRFFHP